MAQKRKNKPIQIALTEEQIANIIREASSQSRGLNVESLEDRIAPSRFGLPVFGGAEDLVGDAPDDAFPEDPNAGDATDPTTTGGDGTTDPTTTDGTDGPGDTVTEGDDLPEDPNAPDPFADPASDPFTDPNDPFAGEEGGELESDPLADPHLSDPEFLEQHPELADGPIEDGIFSEGGGLEEMGYEGENAELAAAGIDPSNAALWEVQFDQEAWFSSLPEGMPEDMKHEIVDALQQANEEILQAAEESGNDYPPQEELMQHRLNILRNLRGG